MISSHARAAKIRTDLEEDLSWRRDEIRNLRNMGSSNVGRVGEVCRRRALLVMLYAHLEGFSKFALEEYAKSINDCKVSILDAKKNLSAAALSEQFKMYRSSDHSDPHDPAGNRARQVTKDADLIAEILSLQNSPINLPVESVTSADSNLTPSVLRRNLISLALDETDFIRYTSTLEGLLKLRNNIAHGGNLNLPSDPNFHKLETRIFDLCENIMRTIYESVRDESFRN